MEEWLEKKGFKKLWNLSSNGSFKVRVSRMISWVFVKGKGDIFGGFVQGGSRHEMAEMGGV